MWKSCNKCGEQNEDLLICTWNCFPMHLECRKIMYLLLSGCYCWSYILFLCILISLVHSFLPFIHILISPLFPHYSDPHTVTHSYRKSLPSLPLTRAESRIVTHLLPALDLRRICLMPVTASASSEKGKVKHERRGNLSPETGANDWILQ